MVSCTTSAKLLTVWECKVNVLSSASWTRQAFSSLILMASVSPEAWTTYNLLTDGRLGQSPKSCWMSKNDTWEMTKNKSQLKRQLRHYFTLSGDGWCELINTMYQSFTVLLTTTWLWIFIIKSYLCWNVTCGYWGQRHFHWSWFSSWCQTDSRSFRLRRLTNSSHSVASDLGRIS